MPTFRAALVRLLSKSVSTNETGVRVVVPGWFKPLCSTTGATVADPLTPRASVGGSS